MNILIFRTVVIYMLIVLAMRLMGKRQLGELQPSELVSTILISNLASISIESPELPLTASIVPVFIIVSLEILVSAACVKSRAIAKIVSGAPRVVIKNGKIDQKMLKELRYSAEDLIESLRVKDVFDVSSVDYAIVETNGSLSVFKKFGADTTTNQSMKAEFPDNHGPALNFVLDGEIDEDNLKYYHKNKDWIMQQCKNKKCKLEDILLLSCDAQNKIVLIKKENC